jgi:hypothetical protein
MAVVVLDWAGAAAKAFIRAYGVSVPVKWAPLWVNWPIKLVETQEPIGGRRRPADLLDELKGAPLLVLDDVGAEFAKMDGWGDTLLYTVLEARNSAHRATLWTSNLSKKELTSRYGPRIVSRLVGMAPALEVPLCLPDRRFLAAEARMRALANRVQGVSSGPLLAEPEMELGLSDQPVKGEPASANVVPLHSLQILRRAL